MAAVAASLALDELNRVDFRLYERFRRDVSHFAEGWRAKAKLRIDRIRSAMG